MRNTRWMLLTLSALSKIGADAVLLNTGFGAPQIADVCESEDAKAVIYDAEFDSLFEEAKDDMLYILGYVAEDEQEVKGDKLTPGRSARHRDQARPAVSTAAARSS